MDKRRWEIATGDIPYQRVYAFLTVAGVVLLVVSMGLSIRAGDTTMAWRFGVGHVALAVLIIAGLSRDENLPAANMWLAAVIGLTFRVVGQMFSLGPNHHPVWWSLVSYGTVISYLFVGGQGIVNVFVLGDAARRAWRSLDAAKRAKYVTDFCVSIGASLVASFLASIVARALKP